MAPSNTSPADSTLRYREPAVPAPPPGWTDPRVFGYRPEALGLFQRRWLIAQACIMAVFVAIFATAAMLLHRGNIWITLFAWGTVMGIYAALKAIRIWRTAVNHRQAWPTFRIMIAPQGIARTCRGYPDLILPRDAIRDIRRMPRGILVRGRSSLQKIWISNEYMESFAEIEAALAGFMPMRQITGYWPRAVLNIGLSLALVGAMFAILVLGLWTDKLWLAGACLIAISAWAVWTIVATLRNPNLTRSYKFNALWVLIFPLVLGLRILWLIVLQFL